MKTYLSLGLAALLALTLAFAACGGDGDDDGNGGTAGPNGVPAASGRENLDPPGPDSPTLSATEASAAVGEDVDATLEVLGFGPPGLGAWTVDVSYDADVISIVECAADPGGEAQSVCNPDFGDSVLRITGAVAVGLEGDTTIGVLTLRCESAGTSPLSLAIDVLADATIGDPTETAVHMTDGSVTCGDGAGGGDEATPTTE